MKVTFTSFIFLSCFFSLNAQTPDWIYSFYAYINDITTDVEGNIIVCGESGSDFLTTDGIPVQVFGNNDVYITKFNPNGEVIWAKTAGGPYTETAYVLDTDVEGNIYVVGLYYDQITFGDHQLNAMNSGSDMFLTKINPDGEFLLARRFFNADWSSQIYPRDLFISDAGEIFLCGEISVPWALYQCPFEGAHTGDIFLIKFTENGYCDWAHNYGYGGVDGISGYSMDMDSQGHLYMTGNFRAIGYFDDFDPETYLFDDVFLMQVDPATGFVNWVRSAGGNGTDKAYDMMIDANDRIYIVGQFYQSAEFGSQLISGEGSMSGFLACYDTNGGCQWARSMESNGSVIANSITTDGQGNVVVSGSFKDGNIDLHGLILDYDGCYENIFGAFYSPDGELIRGFRGYGCYTWPEQLEFANDRLIMVGNYEYQLNFGNNLIVEEQGEFEFLTALDISMVCGAYLPDVYSVNGVFFTGDVADEYQWINCETGFDVLGETDQSLSPEPGVEYALQIVSGECTFISPCFSDATVGLTEYNGAHDNLHIYPSPADEILRIQLNNKEDIHVNLYNSSGQVVLSQFFNQVNALIFDTQTFESGVYSMKVFTSGGKMYSSKVIILHD